MNRKRKSTVAVTNKKESRGGNKENYTLCIDTLTLTMIPKEKGRVFDYNALNKDYWSETNSGYDIGDNYLLTHSGEDDNSYNYSFNVLYYGEKVATIHLNGRKRRKEYIKLDFVNHVFYQIGKGWYAHYVGLSGLLGIKLNNVSSIHVAYDSHGTYEWHRDKYRLTHWNLGLGHKDIRYIPLTGTLYSLVGSTLIVGQLRSGKRVACYRKSMEINISGKWYIRSFHERNGLDVSKQVDRVEVRLTNHWLKNFDFGLEELNTQKGLEELFLAAVKDVGFRDMTTEVKSKDTDYKRRYKKIYLIDPATFDARPMERIRIVGLKNSDGNSVSSLRKTFKDVLFSYIRHGKAQDLSYLRYYVYSSSNWIERDNGRHNGLICLAEVNRDIYRQLATRYAKDYGKKGENLSKETAERKNRIEGLLFDTLPTPVAVESQGKMVKVLSATAAMYSPYLFAPPLV